MPMAHAFGEIKSSRYIASSRAEQVNTSLRWLNRLEFKDWVPPSVAFIVRHRDEPEAMHTFFLDLERLAYYMLVTSKSVYERIDRFASVTREVEAGSKLAADDSSLQLLPHEQYEFYEALDGP